MAKEAYVGINNIARRVKRIYIGINNIARKVEKAYIGVNGKARLFFHLIDNLQKVSNATNLPAKRHGPVGGKVGDYALIAGGSGSGDNLKTLYSYNSNLVQATQANLAYSTGINNQSAANSEYCLFKYDLGTNMMAYNKALVATTNISFYQDAQYYGGGCSNNYAIFGGGSKRGIWNTKYNNVIVFNTSLTKTALSSLTTNNTNIGVSSNANYIIFSPGYNSNEVNLYNISTLVKSTNATTSRNASNSTSYKRMCRTEYMIMYLWI